MCGSSGQIPFEDEPRFIGGAEISLVHGDLSLTFDKAKRAYSFTCYGDDGEGVRLTLEPSEVEQIVRELLSARAWPGSAGVQLEPLVLSPGIDRAVEGAGTVLWVDLASPGEER